MFQGSSLTIWWPSEIQLSHTKYEFLLITHKNIFFFFKEKEKKKSRERGKEWDLELKLTGLGWWGLLVGYTVEAEWHTQAYSLFFKSVTTNTWALHQQPLTSSGRTEPEASADTVRKRVNSWPVIFSRITPSERPGWKLFISIVSPICISGFLKVILKKKEKIMYISFSYLMWL